MRVVYYNSTERNCNLPTFNKKITGKRCYKLSKGIVNLLILTGMITIEYSINKYKMLHVINFCIIV